MNAVVNEIKSVECFTLQVHCSVDQYSVDNKFITAQYLGEVKTNEDCFLVSATLICAVRKDSLVSEQFLNGTSAHKWL